MWLCAVGHVDLFDPDPAHANLSRGCTLTPCQPNFKRTLADLMRAHSWLIRNPSERIEKHADARQKEISLISLGQGFSPYMLLGITMIDKNRLRVKTSRLTRATGVSARVLARSLEGPCRRLIEQKFERGFHIHG